LARKREIQEILKEKIEEKRKRRSKLGEKDVIEGEDELNEKEEVEIELLKKEYKQLMGIEKHEK